jgi:hypothetical protein
MSEKKEGKSLEELVSPQTTRQEFVELVKDLLVPDEVIDINPLRDVAADTLVECFSFLGAFSPDPAATINKEALAFTGGSALGLDDQAVGTIWNFLLRTGALKESDKYPDRAVIPGKIITMLRNPTNGFLTED